MRLSRNAVAVLTLALLALPVLAVAQEPVRDFALLNTRLAPGDTIWVTDAHGREVKGRITALGADALTLEGGAGTTFASADVTTIEVRRSDSLGNGALIGMGVGGVGTAVVCLAAAGGGGEREWCVLAAVVYGGIGAAIGVAIDAMIPGKKLVAYRAPGSTGSSPARFSIAPFVTPRAKGVAVSFAF